MPGVDVFTIEKQYPEAAYFLECWIRAQNDLRDDECKGKGPFALSRKVAGEFAFEEVESVVRDSLRDLRQLRQETRWRFEDLERLTNLLMRNKARAEQFLDDMIRNIEGALAARQRGTSSPFGMRRKKR